MHEQLWTTILVLVAQEEQALQFWNLADPDACIEETDRMREDLDAKAQIPDPRAESIPILSRYIAADGREEPIYIVDA